MNENPFKYSFMLLKWWASGRKCRGKKLIFDGPFTHPKKTDFHAKVFARKNFSVELITDN